MCASTAPPTPQEIRPAEPASPAASDSAPHATSALRRVFGTPPSAIASKEEADLELRREQIRDSRWNRRERQLKWAAGFVGAPTILALVARVIDLFAG